MSGYEKDSGIWKAVRGWFSLYEVMEAASQGGHLSGISNEIVKRSTSMDAEAWSLFDYGRILACGAG